MCATIKTQNSLNYVLGPT